MADDQDRWVVQGYRCRECGYRLAVERPRCPVCRAALDAHKFGPEGRVWAATILRAGVVDRQPPLGLAYVDLDDGPRVLCHFGDVADPGSAPLPGTRVELVGLTDQGDPKVRIL
jgi:uncharacterized OB-fold protein